MRTIWLGSLTALVLSLGLPGSASAGLGGDARVIVKYRTGASPGKRRASIRALGDVPVVGGRRGPGTRVLQVAGGAWEAAQRLARAPGVAWAEPDYELHVLNAPDDPLLGQL